MQLRTVFWTLLLLAVLLALLASPVSAQLNSWYFGGAFNVGGVHFRVGFAEMGRYGPSYYFEAARPFAYRSYTCSSQCYRRGDHYYHHPTCGVVNHHFRQHGYAPSHVIEYYGPPVAYPQPNYYRYYSQPGYQYPQRHYFYDKHSRKNQRHHTPPGHYKRHHRH